MKLGEVLSPAHVRVPLPATTLRDATRQLAKALVASGAVTDAKRLDTLIKDARPEDVVSVADQAFLPHFRTDAARELRAAIGVTPEPIASEQDSRRAGRIVILIVAPPREAARYLQIVSALARALKEPEVVEALLRAATAEAVLGIPAFDAELPSRLTVRDLMTPNVLAVQPTQTLGEAVRLMMERNVRAVPVVSDTGALVGILTDREILKYLVPEYVQRTKSGGYRTLTRSEIRGTSDPRLIPVQEAMSRSVLCLSEDQELADVANIMISRETDRYPVVREGVVVGFLTRADIVRRLVTL